MAWRPDGKVLAIAYSSGIKLVYSYQFQINIRLLGEVFLINVENKSILHKIRIEGNITCVIWINEKIINKNITYSNTEEDEATSYLQRMVRFSVICRTVIKNKNEF